MYLWSRDNFNVSSLTAVSDMNAVVPLSQPPAVPTFNIRADGGYIYANNLQATGLMVSIWAFRGMNVQNLDATATMEIPAPQSQYGLLIESFGLAQILGGSLMGPTVKLSWDQFVTASLSVQATAPMPFRSPNLYINVLSNMTSQNDLSVSLR